MKCEIVCSTDIISQPLDSALGFLFVQAAQTVFVWIGQAEERTERRDPQARRLDSSMGGISTRNSALIISSNTCTPQKAFYKIPKDFSEYLQRGSFRRIWVMQEVWVCRNATVVCGRLNTDCEDLSTAFFAVVFIAKKGCRWALEQDSIRNL